MDNDCVLAMCRQSLAVRAKSVVVQGMWMWSARLQVAAGGKLEGWLGLPPATRKAGKQQPLPDRECHILRTHHHRHVMTRRQPSQRVLSAMDLQPRSRVFLDSQEPWPFGTFDSFPHSAKRETLTRSLRPRDPADHFVYY